MLGRLIAMCGVLVSGTAFANDSIGELGTGGIILSRTDAVSMLSEDLSISRSVVVLAYEQLLAEGCVRLARRRPTQYKPFVEARVHQETRAREAACSGSFRISRC